MNRIGIDLGGTKIEGILLDQKNNLIERKRIPTNRDEGYLNIVERLGGLVNELKSIAKGKTSVGICTPGAISRHTGRIKNSNTICLIDKPLKEDIERLIDQEVRMENDANCFSIAEALRGAAAKYEMVFGVIMGTGVGGGIVNKGELFTGHNSIAGEWGHHTLHPGGRKCYCGKSGCVETYISGPALEKRWQELTGEKLSLKDIIEFCHKKELFKEWKKEFLNNFGIAVANVINILDPNVIILGGGVSNIDFLFDEGIKSVYNNVFSDKVDTPILKNQLGDSAGVYGAADLW